MFDFFKRKPDQNVGEKLTLKLSGLHCTSCAVNIDLTLEDLPGIAESKTNYARSTAEVYYDPEKINQDKIITEIKKLGYRAESA